MKPLEELTQIVADELGHTAALNLVGSARKSAIDKGAHAGDQAAVVEWLWDGLAAAKPEAFVGPTDCCSGLGLAYRYVRRRQPEQLGPVELSADDRKTLARVRSLLREWSGLTHWGRFRHVQFADDCRPLLATVAVRGKSGKYGGSAFTWHRGLSNTALYPSARVREYREDHPACLLGVLLHEEAHLAAARVVPWFDGEGALADALHEAAGELVGYVGILLAEDAEATSIDLATYLSDWEIADLRAFTASLGDVGLPAIIHSTFLLAIAAASGPDALAAAAARLVPHPDPLCVLERAFGVTNSPNPTARRSLSGSL